MPDQTVLLSTAQITWIIVAVLVVLVLLAVLGALARRRRATRQEQARARAEEIRREAATQQPAVKEAELEAEQRRVDAERADLAARKAEREASQTRAQREDRLREADRIDPDVKHRSRGYRPTEPETAQGTAPGTTPASGGDAPHAGTASDRASTSSTAAAAGATASGDTHGEGTGTDSRPAAFGDGSIEEELRYDDTYVDEDGVLRDADGTEHRPRGDYQNPPG